MVFRLFPVLRDLLRLQRKRQKSRTKSDIRCLSKLLPEAVERAIGYGFEVLGLDALTVCHFRENDRSRRVIEKTGFRYLKPFVYNTRDGRHLESMLYILTREDYENRLKTTKGA